MRVGIYYPFVAYMGGGERYAFAIAEYLSQKHSVELFAFEIERVPEVAAGLGYDFSRVKLHGIENRFNLLKRTLGSAHFDLFFCVSNYPTPPIASLGHVGILIIQFPTRRKRRYFPMIYTIEWVRLSSYHRIVLYSQFVARWMAKRRIKAIPEYILAPPVDVDMVTDINVKARIILSVGRFFSEGHNKRHKDMIIAFRNLVDDGLRDWELHLVGSLRPEHEHQRYFEEVQQEACGYPIVIHTDMTSVALGELRRRAAIYWHATGYGTSEANYPEFMEHFGITTVEAMAAGCFPIVIARGAQPELVEHGINGFLWQTLPELQVRTLDYIAAVPQVQHQWRLAAQQTSQHYNLPAFKSRLDALIAEVMRNT